ncbi:MAG: ferredoxin [Chloroflexi bacterium]|nr:ferredoxin [Chloroflexota bacterium]
MSDICNAGTPKFMISSRGMLYTGAIAGRQASDRLESLSYWGGQVRIKVDLKLCTGVGNCAAVAPTVFRLNEKRRADVLDPSSVSEESLWEAAESCPEGAIILEDDNGNQVYP